MARKGSRLNSHLKKTELKKLNDKLLAEVERITNKINLEIADHESDSGDDVDNANNTILQAAELRFATREHLYLKKLKKTLAIVDTEEYGMCEDCGAQITFERLWARPTSTLCISCKEEAERDELQSYHGRQSKSLGKQMGLTGSR
jgi:DnaK suppressor protein